MLADSSEEMPAVREATARARRLGHPVLASWTQPASAEAVGFFAQAAASEDRALWLRPSSAEALVGIGAARTLIGRGAERFKQVGAAWRDLLADAVVEDAAGQPTSGPLLLGGFSFDPLRDRSSLWDGFPDARMVLPERALLVREGAAWLTTSVVVDPDQPAQQPQAPGVDTPAARILSPAAWKALVGSVARGIRHGQLGLEKVVLARAFQVEQDRPLDLVGALRKLESSYPSCTVFAIAHGDACFLGATPERLITLHDGTAATMALAGSVSRGATPDEDQKLAEQLLGSSKDRAEHAFVVSAVRDAMAQVCTRVVADTQPRIRQLPNLQHLLTPIRGQVAAGYGVLDLVERIHPTPAMGGVPRQRALELIRECESLDRGWYAGPIGWLNRAGEGEFVVGIRSALVRGGSATLFAGCGIVADSDPNAEFAEAGWKLRPMLGALGIDA